MVALHMTQADRARHTKISRVTRLCSDAGFQLVDTMITLSVAAIIAAIAVPMTLSGLGDQQLAADARLLEQTLQDARLKAIQSNRPIRVMFNCPVTGQFRIVELLGTPDVPTSNDGQLARCDETTYPYPVAGGS